MTPARTDKATGKPTGGWRAVAAVTLMAAAAAVPSAWLIGSALPGPSGAFFGRLLDLVGGWTVVGGALAAGAAGAFLLYTARWRAMPGGAGLARGERRRGLVARVLLSVAASAMLLAIPAHVVLYTLAGQARDCEFCGLAGFMLLFPVGLVALLAELTGLAIIGADHDDLAMRVSVVLVFVTVVEPLLLLGFPAFPVLGVVLATAGIAAVLAALVWLLRARPRPPMLPT